MTAAGGADTGRGGSGRWEPERTGDGSWTLRHPDHGDTCHSRAGAWQEARERYALPCRLRERARGPFLRQRFYLLDVGTGLGLNLAAALEALEDTGVELSAVGLELDPGVLHAALRLPVGASDDPWRPWWQCVRDGLRQALDDPVRAGAPAGLELETPGGGRWRLRLVADDARRAVRRLEPQVGFDAVFLDPFAPATEPDLWDTRFLADVAARMRPGSWLSTYSAALSVRAALVRAGLRVGPGPRVGTKAEGTLASPDRDPGAFDPRVERRLQRRLSRS